MPFLRVLSLAPARWRPSVRDWPSVTVSAAAPFVSLHRADAAFSATMPAGMQTDSRALVGLRWLVRVRWGAAAGLVVSALIARLWLDLPVPIAVLSAIAALTIVTNLAVSRALGRGDVLQNALAGGLLVFDTILLTAILALTGGPANPFSVFYLVYITLAAVVLGARWTWSLMLLAACAYALLFLALPTPQTHHAEPALDTHLQGMWWAFILAALLTAYFVVKLSTSLEERDRELQTAREQAARNERLASLTTLAAGAAHELSTPLATIAVVTREMELALQRAGLASDDQLVTDARLIRDELQRCRAILDRMATQAGETIGEMPRRMAVRDVVTEAVKALPLDEAARIDVQAPDAVATLTVPSRGVVTALVSLLRNALDASADAQRVELTAEAGADGVRLVVRDTGHGMPADVLARAGEPFFSTKPAGAGLGLGLFLTRALAERIGGVLSLESTPGAGTVATLDLPLRVGETSTAPLREAGEPAS